jgi:5-formyltetrahydrofolate cyclo-ligase
MAGNSDKTDWPEYAGTPGAAGTPERSGESSPASKSRPARLNVPGSADANRTGRGGSAAPADPAGLAAAKAAIRARVLAGRRVLTTEQRAAAGRRLRDAVLDMPEMQMAGTVAAYVSVGAEPDTRGLLFALWKRGAYVLLPVLQPDGDLDWASYEGPDSLAPGPRGLLEPTEARRGVTAITSADLVIVPALAVDRAGQRLGRGGGSYDRALARVGASILTVALLHDGELVGQVPAGPHDQPVRAAALPAEGISRLR